MRSMNEKKADRTLKIAIAILVVCLLGLGFYTVQSSISRSDDLEILQEEKEVLKTELESLLANYEKIAKENATNASHLEVAQEKIKTLLDSLSQSKATYVLMRKYKAQVRFLKQEKVVLLYAIDSLQLVNTQLKDEIQDTKTQLAETSEKSSVLVKKNKQLAQKVKQAAQLKLVKLRVEAVKVRNNGKIKPVESARRTDKINLCFTLAENALATAGKKVFYLQIINPENNVIGQKGSIRFGEKKLVYSKKIAVMYANKRMTPCTLISAKEEDLPEGKYWVAVFLGSKQVGSSSFTLD